MTPTEVDVETQERGGTFSTLIFMVSSLVSGLEPKSKWRLRLTGVGFL